MAIDPDLLAGGVICALLGANITDLVPHKVKYLQAAWARLAQWYFAWAMSSLKKCGQCQSPAYLEAFWGYHKWQSKERCLMEEIHDGHRPR